MKKKLLFDGFAYRVSKKKGGKTEITFMYFLKTYFKLNANTNHSEKKEILFTDKKKNLYE